MDSNTGRHSRKSAPKLTYIPETENYIAAHLHLYVVGDLAYRFCKRLVRDERSERYCQKVSEAMLSSSGDAIQTPPAADMPVGRLPSVTVEELIFYGLLGDPIDSSGLAKVRLTFMEGFGDELPEASQDMGMPVGILFLFGNLQQTSNISQTSVKNRLSASGKSDDEQLADLRTRLVQLAHNRKRRPFAAIMAFGVSSEIQEKVGALAQASGIEAGLETSFFEEDDSDSLFIGVKDVCMKLVEYQARTPAPVEAEEQVTEKASTRCSCAIA